MQMHSNTQPIVIVWFHSFYLVRVLGIWKILHSNRSKIIQHWSFIGHILRHQRYQSVANIGFTRADFEFGAFEVPDIRVWWK